MTCVLGASEALIDTYRNATTVEYEKDELDHDRLNRYNSETSGLRI